MAAISREEYDEWKEHPVTVALFRIIQKDLGHMQDLLIEVDLQDVAELQGRCKTCRNLLDMDYESLYD